MKTILLIVLGIFIGYSIYSYSNNCSSYYMIYKDNAVKTKVCSTDEVIQRIDYHLSKLNDLRQK